MTVVLIAFEGTVDNVGKVGEFEFSSLIPVSFFLFLLDCVAVTILFAYKGERDKTKKLLDNFEKLLKNPKSFKNPKEILEKERRVPFTSNKKERRDSL